MRLSDSSVTAKELCFYSPGYSGILQSRQGILPFPCLQTWKRVKFLLSRKSSLALEFQVPGMDVKLQQRHFLIGQWGLTWVSCWVWGTDNEEFKGNFVEISSGGSGSQVIHKLFWGIGYCTCFQSEKDVTPGGGKWGLVLGFCWVVLVFGVFVCLGVYFNQILCSLFRAVLEKQVLLWVEDPLQWEILNFVSLAV